MISEVKGERSIWKTSLSTKEISFGGLKSNTTINFDVEVKSPFMDRLFCGWTFGFFNS